MRQLTDASGEITLAKSYDPYGTVTLSSGSGTSPFAYTGEQQDASGLTYLRARYYSSGDGRFLSRDTWGGDYNRPLSLNRWGYVEGNPVNFVDPTGHISEGMQARKADLIVEKLKSYNVYVVKDWGYKLIPIPNPKSSRYQPTTYRCEWQEGNWRNVRELEWTLDGVGAMAKKLGGIGRFWVALRGRPIKFVRMAEDKHPRGAAAWTILDVKIYNDTYYHGKMVAGAIITHELAHVWDTRQFPVFKLSKEMNSRTKSFDIYCNNDFDSSCFKFNNRGELPPTPYGQTGPREDFADSFAICVYPNFKGVPSLKNYPTRKGYIEGLLNGNKCSQ
ncbi:MAG: RHS repeat-associated core domain-containing protein [Anaerolineales bacterium]|nr:RHS repeat-associated core domain-containing protein [Anaerolineales bacterium]